MMDTYLAELTYWTRVYMAAGIFFLVAVVGLVLMFRAEESHD